MSQVHIPVLLNEVLDAITTMSSTESIIYYDGTYGRGGHFRAVQEKFKPKLSFITDQDETAISSAQKDWAHLVKNDSLNIIHKNFRDFIFDNQNKQKFNFVLLDLGVSSPQLDEADRGFSFNKDGPLDMRMNRSVNLTGADIVNQYEAEELISIFKNFGEVQNPARVVRAIVNDRVTKPFITTLQLAGLIERVDGWKKKGFHPATQYFMALRLAVNSELSVIEESLPLLIEQMQDQGRIAVITFHSLEDRIVKNIFKDSEVGFLVSKKVIVPSEEECKINPRARSAKLRVFQKGKPPEKPDKFALRRMQRELQSKT